MSRPAVSWLPVRFAASYERCGFPPLEDWLARAYVLGLRQVELPWSVLPGHTPEVLRAVSRRLDRHGLGVSAINCATQFAGPDPDVIHAAHFRALEAAKAARAFGAPVLVVTAGSARPDVPVSDSVATAAEGIARMADEVDRLGVTPCLVNDTRPRGQSQGSVVARSEVFLDLLQRLSSAPVRVCFNTGSPLVSAQDPAELLGSVIDRVAHVHIADRLPGGVHNTTCGQGAVEFEPLLRRLSEAGYRGALCLEDDDPGGRTQASLTFLRERVAQTWR